MPKDYEKGSDGPLVALKGLKSYTDRLRGELEGMKERLESLEGRVAELESKAQG